MVMSRDQKPYKVVAVEPSALDELAETVVAVAASVNSEESVLASRNGEDPTQAVEILVDLIIDGLSALRTRTEAESIERAADLILDCESRGGRVHVTGIGKSEHIARYVASLLSSTGTPAYFLHATECVHGSAGQVCKHDLTIAVSNSGTTPALLYAVQGRRGVWRQATAAKRRPHSP